MKVTLIFLSFIIFASSLPQEENVKPLQSSILGFTRVNLDASCKRSECNLGNFLADAIVDWNAERYTGEVGWTDASIALIDVASIKSSIVKSGTGEITQSKVDEIFVGTPIVAVDLLGSELVQALEHAVSRYEEGKSYDEFLQHSGLIVEYDVDKPVNQRATSVQIICADCESPLIFNINQTRTYRVLMSKTLADGGHGYSMFVGKQVRELGVTDKQAFLAYLAKRSPIYPAVEWRITITPEIDEVPDDGSASGIKISLFLITLSSFFAMFVNKI